MRVRSSRKDSERLQQETSRGSCWKEAGGCQGALATAAPAMLWLWARYQSRAGMYFVAFCFPSCDAYLTQGRICCQLCVLKQTGPWRAAVSSWSPQEQEAAHSCAGIRAMCLRLVLSPHNGMDTAPLCRVPHVNAFTQCSEGHSLLALCSLQKL